MVVYETIFTERKRSLGQGYIFSSVCQEFCPGGGGAWSQGVPGVGAWSWVVPGPGGCLVPCGIWSRPTTKGGSLGRSGPGPHPRGEVEGELASPPPMATAAGGTHPTGMHSCFVYAFEQKILTDLKKYSHTQSI